MSGLDRCLVSFVPASFIGSSGGGIAQVVHRSAVEQVVTLTAGVTVHCIYVSVTKPTCPAFSALLNTGITRSTKVTGKAIMLCSDDININVMCSTTWPI